MYFIPQKQLTKALVEYKFPEINSKIEVGAERDFSFDTTFKESSSSAG
jgi:hypothetical protein